MAQKKTGIREIAEQAGIAMSTVSHALNGTAPISAEVRARVIAIAAETGYLAQRQAKGSIAAIAKLMVAVPEDALPDSDVNLVSWTILSNLTKTCKASGIKVVPFSLLPRHAPEDLIAAARAEDVDGLVLINQDSDGFLAALQASGLASVLINGEDAKMRVDSVTPGNRFASQMATEWLIDQGHKKVMHLTWEGRKTVRRRLDGFMDGLMEAGIAAGPETVLMAAGYEPRFGEERVAAWLKENGGLGGVTALFCAADNLAFGAIKALQAAGYNVPEDASVMGFDGVALGEFHRPELTTVAVPLEQFATEALSLLRQRIISGTEPRASRRVELGCVLIERESVRSLRRT